MEGVGSTRVLAAGLGGVVVRQGVAGQTVLANQFRFGFGKVPDREDEIKKAIAKALRSFPEHEYKRPNGIARRVLKTIFAEYEMLEALKY